MSAPNCSPNSVMLTSKDTKASVAFYRDVLGFEVSEAWPDENKPMWCNLTLDGQSIMVGDAPPEGEACGDPSEASTAFSNAHFDAWRKASQPGAGISMYLMVDDVDAYHDRVKGNGAAPAYEPKTQFYGIRDFPVSDPDGYSLVFYSPAKLESCQSCGMPLADAEPGQMYCQYCTTDNGQLKSWDEVFEGTVTGFFMGMQKMERGPAEAAAKEHLTKMPAWISRAGV